MSSYGAHFAEVNIMNGNISFSPLVYVLRDNTYWERDVDP